MLTKTQHHWLLSHFIGDGGLQAEADSALDRKLSKLEKAGVLTCYDAMFGNNYYLLTTKGRAALMRPDHKM